VTVFTDTSAAFDARLSTMTNLPPVASENEQYTPTQGTLYLRPTLLPGETVQASLGSAGHDVTNGIYQVDIFAEAGQGKAEAIAMADNVANHMKRGTILTYNSRDVIIKSAQRRAGIESDGWYQLPVEIVFITYTAARA